METKETRPYVDWETIGGFLVDAFVAYGVPREDAEICADVLAGKPLIITTNLDINGIHAQYGERIASRIIGEYVPIKFEGEDIRQLKKFQY